MQSVGYAQAGKKQSNGNQDLKVEDLAVDDLRGTKGYQKIKEKEAEEIPGDIVHFNFA